MKWHDDQVCVVQLASSRHVVLLDALSLPSTAMQMHLQALFEDEGVVKVCHGHINNLAWVLDIGMISPIFDIAEHAQALHGLPPDGQPSLEAMCCRYLNYQLKNMYQNANWRQRPMPAEMLQYAAMEVGALLPLGFALEVATDKVAMDVRLQDAESETASANEFEFFC